MGKKKTIQDFCYDSLMEWTLVLLSIINELPNVEEIKASKKYRKAYLKFNNDFGKYLQTKIKKGK